VLLQKLAAVPISALAPASALLELSFHNGDDAILKARRE
jgi:hypothetical protein